MGEIYLSENGDGGNVSIKDNFDIQEDPSLQTFVYLSLFSGLSPLDVITKEKFSDSFEKSLDAKQTAANFQRSEALGNSQLSWMVDAGLVQSANVIVLPKKNDRVNVNVELVVNDEKLYITFDDFKNGKKIVATGLDTARYKAFMNGLAYFNIPQIYIDEFETFEIEFKFKSYTTGYRTILGIEDGRFRTSTIYIDDNNAILMKSQSAGIYNSQNNVFVNEINEVKFSRDENYNISVNTNGLIQKYLYDPEDTLPTSKARFTIDKFAWGGELPEQVFNGELYGFRVSKNGINVFDSYFNGVGLFDSVSKTLIKSSGNPVTYERL